MPEGSELPVPGFVWKEDEPPKEEKGFAWAGDAPEPLPGIPFKFADESEAEETDQEPLPPPPIPFRFAGEESTREEDPEAEDDDLPRRSVPRLGFRWRG